MRAGDVAYADLGEPVGHEQGLTRLVVIVTADEFNDGSTMAIVPCSRTIRGWELEVEMPGYTRDGNREGVTVAQCWNARTISRMRLETGIVGNVGPVLLAQIRESMSLWFGIE